MPTNFTSISNGAAANASTFNTPLGQLDTALVNLMTVSATISATWNVTANMGFSTASPLARIHVGSGSTNASTDSQILISHLVNDTGSMSGISGHGFSDSSAITRTGTVAYCSYDARTTFSGSASYNHNAAFQDGITYSATGTLSNLYSFFSNPTITSASGVVTNRQAFYAHETTVSGGASLTNNFGLYVEALTAGSVNYAVYTLGTTPSIFGGNVTVGRFSTAGTLTVGNQTSNSTQATVSWAGKSSGATPINANLNLTTGALWELNTQAVSAVWSVNTTNGTITYAGSAVYASGKSITLNAGNIATDTTTGTKIGTATSQKLGLWNATPIIQPTTGVSAATFTANSGTAVNDASTFDSYTIGQVVKALRNIGALA